MGKFALMALPYELDALEPVISKQTLEFHHGKHLAAYVNNLNALLDGSGFEEATLEEIVCKAEGGIKPAKSEPTGPLANAIANTFGSFEAFKEEFQKKGATLFGSGWVWFSADRAGQLFITQEANAANPVQKGLTPLLTFDVWEHAYYLDYQNRRPDHLSALWSIINWEEVERRYGKARM